MSEPRGVSEMAEQFYRVTWIPRDRERAAAERWAADIRAGVSLWDRVDPADLEKSRDFATENDAFSFASAAALPDDAFGQVRVEEIVMVPQSDHIGSWDEEETCRVAHVCEPNETGFDWQPWS